MNFEVPSWLQQIAKPANTDIAAKSIGTLAGGAMLRATAQPDEEGNMPTFRDSLTEARLNQQDPLWKLKANRMKTQMMAEEVQMKGQILKDKIAQKTMEDEDYDLHGMAEITKQAGGDPIKLRDGLRKFGPKSIRGSDAHDKLMRASIDSEQSKIRLKNADDYATALGKLPPGEIEDDMYLNGDAPTTEKWRKLREKQQKSPMGGLNPDSAIGKLLYEKYNIPNTPENAEIHKQYDAQIAQLTSKGGKAIFMGMDDNGKPIFQMTEGGASAIGSPTVATQTGVQRRLLKYEGAVQLMNDLERTIKPEYLGAQGAIGEMAVDKGLAQLVPEMANRGRVDFRSGLIAARESLLREISDDSRFSNLDREEITKALPSSGFFESLPAAKQSLQTVRRILSQRGKIYASGINVKQPIWTMTPEEIKAAYEKKEITEQEGIDALKRFH